MPAELRRYEFSAVAVAEASSLHEAIAAVYDVSRGGISFEAEGVDRVEVVITIDPDQEPDVLGPRS